MGSVQQLAELLFLDRYVVYLVRSGVCRVGLDNLNLNLNVLCGADGAVPR